MIETTIYSTLSGHSGLVALVGTRVYPLKIPQNTPLPVVVFWKVSTRPAHTLGGFSIESPRFQIDIWGDTYDEVKAVGGQVRAAMAGIPALLQSEMDEYDSEADLYRLSTDYTLWVKE